MQQPVATKLFLDDVLESIQTQFDLDEEASQCLIFEYETDLPQGPLQEEVESSLLYHS